MYISEDIKKVFFDQDNFRVVISHMIENNYEENIYVSKEQVYKQNEEGVYDIHEEETAQATSFTAKLSPREHRYDRASRVADYLTKQGKYAIEPLHIKSLRTGIGMDNVLNTLTVREDDRLITIYFHFRNVVFNPERDATIKSSMGIFPMFNYYAMSFDKDTKEFYLRVGGDKHQIAFMKLPNLSARNPDSPLDFYYGPLIGIIQSINKSEKRKLIAKSFDKLLMSSEDFEEMVDIISIWTEAIEASLSIDKPWLKEEMIQDVIKINQLEQWSYLPRGIQRFFSLTSFTKPQIEKLKQATNQRQAMSAIGIDNTSRKEIRFLESGVMSSQDNIHKLGNYLAARSLCEKVDEYDLLIDYSTHLTTLDAESINSHSNKAPNVTAALFRNSHAKTYAENTGNYLCGDNIRIASAIKGTEQYLKKLSLSKEGAELVKRMKKHFIIELKASFEFYKSDLSRDMRFYDPVRGALQLIGDIVDDLKKIDKGLNEMKADGRRQGTFKRIRDSFVEIVKEDYSLEDFHQLTIALLMDPAFTVGDPQRKEDASPFDYTKSTKKRFNKKVLGYKFELPKSQLELAEVGVSLSICVGQGNYGRAVRDKKLILVLVKDSSDTVIAVLEVVKESLGQAKGKHNNVNFPLEPQVIKSIKTYCDDLGISHEGLRDLNPTQKKVKEGAAARREALRVEALQANAEEAGFDVNNPFHYLEGRFNEHQDPIAVRRQQEGNELIDPDHMPF